MASSESSILEFLDQEIIWYEFFFIENLLKLNKIQMCELDLFF